MSTPFSNVNNGDTIDESHVDRYRVPINDLESGKAQYRVASGTAGSPYEVNFRKVDSTNSEGSYLSSGALQAGQVVVFKANVDSPADASMAIRYEDGASGTLGSEIPLFAGGAQVSAGQIKAGQIVMAVYNDTRFDVIGVSSGVAGPKGDKGDPGETGATGTPGLDGSPGEKGEPGVKGDKGDPGDQGQQGVKGDKGDTGEKGDPGDPNGPPGPKGDKGDPGDDGLPGLKGDKGDTGQAGATGSQGPAGPQGNTGPAGPQGNTGAQGPRGLQGIQGQQGPAGPTNLFGSGATNYIAAWQSGNTLTHNPSTTSNNPLKLLGTRILGSSQALLYLNPSTSEIFHQYSREAYKSNITDISTSIEELMSWRAVEFTWKDAFGGEEDLGLISEEVAAVFPRAAFYDHAWEHVDEVTGEYAVNEDGSPKKLSGDMVPAGVKYEKAWLPMLAAVQDFYLKFQQEQVKLQQEQAKVADLEARLAALEQAFE